MTKVDLMWDTLRQLTNGSRPPYVVNISKTEMKELVDERDALKRWRDAFGDTSKSDPRFMHQIRDALVKIRNDELLTGTIQRLNLVISAIEVEMSKKKPTPQVSDEDRTLAVQLRADAALARAEIACHQQIIDTKTYKANSLEALADRLDGGKVV